MTALSETRLLSVERPFPLESGEVLPRLDIAYETYGALTPGHDNAILIEHALSGTAHAAGYQVGDTRPGWWDNMIGPGKAFDTDRYFVICTNVLGGCNGTTGPASPAPTTNRPYALSFPPVTVRDMTDAQCLLLEHLDIEELLCVAGGSMGGMQTLQLVCDYPARTRSFISIASSMKHSAQQIAFNEVGRRAVMADPRWNEGDYHDGVPPEGGLSVARMIGHITYLSEEMMQEKFGRARREGQDKTIFRPTFQVEHYLDHQGVSFVRRFDANSYLYLTNALDNFDLVAAMGRPGRLRGDGRTRAADLSPLHRLRGLVISFSSDWLYPASQNREIVRFFRTLGVDISYAHISSDHGHDAFLTDTTRQTELVGGFLASL